MSSPVRAVGQVLLGSVLVLAGVAHLTFARTEFQAQVTPWFPADADLVVLVSGVVEVLMGAALLVAWRHPARSVVGLATAALFVAVFPGNIAQLTEHRDAFGLTSDTARAIRLLFQPVLVVWAVWSTGARRMWRQRRVTAEPRP